MLELERPSEKITQSNGDCVNGSFVNENTKVVAGLRLKPPLAHHS